MSRAPWLLGVVVALTPALAVAQPPAALPADRVYEALAKELATGTADAQTVIQGLNLKVTREGNRVTDVDRTDLRNKLRITVTARYGLRVEYAAPTPPADKAGFEAAVRRVLEQAYQQQGLVASAQAAEFRQQRSFVVLAAQPGGPSGGGTLPAGGDLDSLRRQLAAIEQRLAALEGRAPRTGTGAAAAVGPAGAAYTWAWAGYPFFWPYNYTPTYHPAYAWTAYPWSNGVYYYGWYPATAVLYSGGWPAYYGYYAAPYYPAAAAKPATPPPPAASAPAARPAEVVRVSGAQPASAPAASSGATQAEAAALFWRGYDKYFDRDYAAARDLFRQSLEKFDQDARAWYFRGLCELRLGDRDAAAKSLLRGAQVQRQGRPGPDVISQTLERVQGPQREAVLAAQRAAAK